MWFFGSCLLHNKGKWSELKRDADGSLYQTRTCHTCGKWDVLLSGWKVTK